MKYYPFGWVYSRMEYFPLWHLSMKRIKTVSILTCFRAINNKGVRNTYSDAIGKCSHISGWPYRPTVIGRPDLPAPAVFEKMKLTKSHEFF